MTQNQVAYQKMMTDRAAQKETVRHNLDTEDMNRNLAVYQAYKMKNEGDLARSKRLEAVTNAVAKIFSPITNLMSPTSGNVDITRSSSQYSYTE